MLLQSNGYKEKRRERQKVHYLEGRARHPYKHTPAFNRSLTEGSSSSASSGVCAQCRPILSQYEVTFKAMVHQGTALKKRKSINPNPKRTDATPYRDVKQQNEWLQSNVFDSMGNYLYCCACVCAPLDISKQRLARQRRMKQQQSLNPVVEMTKAEVE